MAWIARLNYAVWFIMPTAITCFLFTNQHVMNVSCKGTTQGKFLQNYLKISIILSEKKIFKVLNITISGKTAPPWRPHCRPINIAWRNQLKGHTRKFSTKWFGKPPNSYGAEDFKSFHFRHIMQNNPVLWQPCFSSNQQGLHETFLHNYFEIGQILSEKKILK